VLNIKTYQNIVKITGIINILKSKIFIKIVSKLSIQPKILLIYQILIEVIQITAQIIICIINLFFALT